MLPPISGRNAIGLSVNRVRTYRDKPNPGAFRLSVRYLTQEPRPVAAVESHP